MALCWWYVSAWPSGRRNEGMQPYSPPPPDCLALMMSIRAGSGVPLRRGRWLSMAVKGRHGCQRPLKQERRRAGITKTSG